MNRHFLLILLALFSCKQPIYTDSNDIKEFFSQLDELKFKNTPGFHINGIPFLIDSIEIDNAVFLDIASKEPLFSKEDVLYIERELLADIPEIWDKSLFDSIKVVPESFIDSISQSGPFKITPPYISLSKPYFSKNKEYCLLYFEYYCGTLCAETTLKLYKNVNGKWTIVKSYYSVVS